MTYLNKQNRFTLIELLVVISIIVLLVSSLLPVLAKARFRAKQTLTAANMEQMATGMIMHADDNDGSLPDLEDSYGWIQRFRDSGYDARLLADEYSFLDSTGHPTSGAPAWNDSGNTAGNLNSNYAFRWGPTTARGMADHATTKTPMKLSVAEAAMCLFQEAIRINRSKGTIIGVSNTGKGSSTYRWNSREVSGNSSALNRVDFDPNWVWSAKYDGSIQKIPYSQTVAKKKSNALNVACDQEGF